ncbi:hypothetical protein DFJ74DRAFT_142679 [Hyaloraphidium curvatum]|nr:hypothetical protein DFJ74DRAFT_142679 [Hyaloraphidium curvatum]
MYLAGTHIPPISCPLAAPARRPGRSPRLAVRLCQRHPLPRHLQHLPQAILFPGLPHVVQTVSHPSFLALPGGEVHEPHEVRPPLQVRPARLHQTPRDLCRPSRRHPVRLNGNGRGEGAGERRQSREGARVRGERRAHRGERLRRATAALLRLVRCPRGGFRRRIVGVVRALGRRRVRPGRVPVRGPADPDHRAQLSQHAVHPRQHLRRRALREVRELLHHRQLPVLGGGEEVRDVVQPRGERREGLEERGAARDENGVGGAGGEDAV